MTTVQEKAEAMLRAHPKLARAVQAEVEDDTHYRIAVAVRCGDGMLALALFRHVAIDAFELVRRVEISTAVAS